jgi:hypothetical protein
LVERFFAPYVCHVAYRRGAVLTSNADEYRAKARECEERAEQTRDSYIKEQLIKIAQTWRHMADHLEKYSL